MEKQGGLEKETCEVDILCEENNLDTPGRIDRPYRPMNFQKKKIYIDSIRQQQSSYSDYQKP